MSRPRLGACLAVVALVAFVSPRAQAQTQAPGTAAPGSAAPASGSAPAAKPPGQKSLRELVESAGQHFDKGEFDEAVKDYYAAYERKKIPQLIFNIAQAHRKAGQNQEALIAFERFLKEDPKSPLAPEAEANAAAMRARLEAEKATAERAAAEKLAQQRAAEAEALAKAREAEHKKAEAALLLLTQQKKTPVYKKPWFWVVIGGVVAAGVATGVAVAVTRPQDPSSDLGVRTVEF